MYLRSKRLERCVCTEFPPVSPKESGRTKGVYYFEAQLSDGKRSTRVVSFDTAHLAAMKKAADEDGGRSGELYSQAKYRDMGA